MSNADYSEYRLARLADIEELELGLHLNLTQGFFEHGVLLRHSGPASFIARWLSSGAAGKQAVREELRRQLDRLRSLGIKASYLDSHHHVHLAPGVLGAISGVLHEFGIAQVRLPLDPGLWRTRKLPVFLMALASRHVFERHGFTYLPCFYPMSGHLRDRCRLAETIERLCVRQGKIEVITHPAAFNDLADCRWPDPYQEERLAEFETLLSLAEPSKVGPF